MQKSYSPKFFSLITCLGGIYYGFFLGIFYQPLDYPDEWNFHQELSNVNYSLFNSLYPSGSFIGTLLAAYTTYRFGRVKTTFLTDLLTAISLIIMISINYFEAFFIGRFLMGVSAGVNFPLMIILIREFVLEKDYLSCIVIFQVMNTVGIFFSSLLSIPGIRQLPIGIALIFPIIRMCYYWRMIRLNIDSPIYMLYANEKDGIHPEQDCRKRLEEIYPEKHIETLIDTITVQKTLLQKDFFMGNMFSPEYVAEIMFCIAILFLNQSCGINQVLGYSGQIFKQKNRVIPVIFSAVNFMGGISLFLTVPSRKYKGISRYFLSITFERGLKRFVVGTLLIIIILGVFGFQIIYPSDSDDQKDYTVFLVLGCIYLLIFQYCLGIYPFIYIPVLLPDIGVFMVLVIHSTFGMIVSLSFYFGSNTFQVIFRFCFTASIAGIIIAVVIFKYFLKDKPNVNVRKVDEENKREGEGNEIKKFLSAETKKSQLELK